MVLSIKTVTRASTASAESRTQGEPRHGLGLAATDYTGAAENFHNWPIAGIGVFNMKLCVNKLPDFIRHHVLRRA